MGAVAGRSTRSLGVMKIGYVWECKFCGRANAAGTDHCAVCRNSAIARPIDIDPRYEKELREEEARGKRLQALPPPLRIVVSVLWSICFVGALVAKFAWSLGVGFVGVILAIVTGVPAKVIEEMYAAEPPEDATK